MSTDRCPHGYLYEGTCPRCSGRVCDNNSEPASIDKVLRQATHAGLEHRYFPEPASVAGEAVAWLYTHWGHPKDRAPAELLFHRRERVGEGWTETALGPLSKPTPVEDISISDCHDDGELARYWHQEAMKARALPTPVEAGLRERLDCMPDHVFRSIAESTDVAQCRSRVGALLAALSETLPPPSQEGGDEHD